MSARFGGALVGAVMLALVGVTLPATAAPTAQPQVSTSANAAERESVDLKIKAPGKTNLKRKKWKAFKVAITNLESAPVNGINLRLKGKGITFKKKSVAFGKIAAGATKKKTVRVRVKAKKEREVAFTITSPFVESYANAFTRLLPKYKRKPVQVGTYKGKAEGQKVVFKVNKARRVVNWRTTMLVVCGGWPDPLTYEWGHYNFPRKVKIPKSGRIQAKYKKKNPEFVVNLRATFDGKLVRDGYFSYAGPRHCRGTVHWNAKRK